MTFWRPPVRAAAVAFEHRALAIHAAPGHAGEFFALATHAPRGEVLAGRFPLPELDEPAGSTRLACSPSCAWGRASAEHQRAA